MATKEQYLNFPIQLLEGFMIDHKKCLNNISDYAIYKHSLILEGDTELGQMKVSAKYFGFKIYNIDKNLENGRQLFLKYKGSPSSGIRIKTFWQFYESEKSEFEKITLLSFLALKSIIGTKTMQKCTNEYWLSRMDGKAEKCEINQLSESIRKYASEYYTVKLKNELVFNWGLITYSRYVRGFYISFTMSLHELIFQVEKRRKSNQKKLLVEQNKKGLAMAHLRLGISRP